MFLAFDKQSSLKSKWAILTQSPLYFFFRALLPIFLVFVLLWKLAQRDTLNLEWLRNPYAIIIFSGSCILFYYLFALRLQFAIRLADAKLPIFRSVTITLQSVFYLYVIPTTVGYEITRFVKTFAALPAKSKQLLSQAIILDRVSGFVGSVFLAAGSLFFMNHASYNLSMRQNYALALFALLASVLCICCFFLKFKKYLTSFLSLVIKHKFHLCILIAISVVIQLIRVLAIFWIAQYVEDINISELIFILAIANLASVIPLSFGGITSTEGSSALVAMALGYEMHAALLIASLLFFFISPLS